MDSAKFQPCRLKPVTHEQVFFDKFCLGKFYLLVCKEEFVNFFLDKCTCSKASMIAFQQLHLARKKLSHCRICSSVRVDKENLSKKTRKLRAHSGLVVVMFRISYWSERKKLWKRPSSSSLSSCTELLAKPWDWLRLCVARGRTHQLRFICDNVSSSAHIALVKHNPNHEPATFFLSSNKCDRWWKNQIGASWLLFFSRPLCNCIAGYSENLPKKTC